MNKYFCDRCGKEIGPASAVHSFKVSWTVCSVGDASYVKHLCEVCAKEAVKMLYPEGDA